MVFIIDIEAIDADISEGAQPLIETCACAEEIPQRGCECSGLGIGGEGGCGERAAEGEEDFFAGGLAGADVGGEGGAGLQAGCAKGGHFRGLAAAGGAEVYGREAAGAEEGGEEGEDYYVDGGVGAEFGEGHGGGGGGLAVVDCDVGGGGGVEGVGA